MDADVLVVGAGPVGQAVAATLGNAGLRVVLLEAGDRKPSNRATLPAAGEVVGDDRYGLLEWKVTRALGGTSWQWAIDMPGVGVGVRYCVLEQAVIERRIDGLPVWPIGMDDLEPLYERALDIVGVPGHLKHLVAERESAIDGMKGGQYAFGDRAVFHGSTALKRVGPGVQVRMNATVVALHPDPVRPGALAGVDVRDAAGQVHTVTARAVVLATNTFEAVRLVLLARPEMTSLQRNECVGSGLMDRPRLGGMLHLVSSPPAGFAALAMHDVDGVASMDRLCTPDPLVRSGASSIGLILVPEFGVMRLRRRAERLSHGALVSLPRRVEGVATQRFGKRVGGWIVDASTRSYRWRAALHRRGVASNFDLEWAHWAGREWRRATDWRVTAIVEQLPDHRNRIELSDAVDNHGTPMPRVRWGAPMSVDAIRPSLDHASAATAAANLGTLGWNDEYDAVTSHHMMGGLPFGTDSTTSACDPSGLVRGTSNLFAAGSCLFPTSGHSNPTLTAVALGIHVAQEIRRTLSG